MTNSKYRDLGDLPTQYHKAVPGRIRAYLNGRGIPDLLIDAHQLGWNGWRITIPIFDREGKLTFFKLARDPEDLIPGPKMLATPGAYSELCGWDQVLKKPSQIIICEGEFDRLVLEAKGFMAVTSTGGASVFRPEWAPEFAAIPEVYVCFDNDEAGRSGAVRVAELIPQAKVVELPEEVGKGGDVTDFFVRLGKSSDDFRKLLAEAMPAPPPPQTANGTAHDQRGTSDPALRERTDRIKAELSIAKLIARYVKLQKSGNNLVGLCPFHEDHNPSLTVFPETGTFHCFGCRKHGDVITFVREIEQLSFHQTLDALDHLSAQQHEPQ
jgi:DNA primase